MRFILVDNDKGKFHMISQIYEFQCWVAIVAAQQVL
jgi:hypothetical protein